MSCCLQVRVRVLVCVCVWVCVLGFSQRSLWAMQIYAFKDEQGVVHLTDQPHRDARYRPVRLTAQTVEGPRGRQRLVSKVSMRLIRSPSGPRAVDPDVVVADHPLLRREVLIRRGAPAVPAMPVSDHKKTRLKQRTPKWQRNRFAKMILEAAQRNGLNSALLHSVIRVESDFDPNATSSKGAVGLMQLMPATAKHYGVWDSTDPEANIHGGARFLAELLKRFDNDLELSLAAYNAGPTAVNRYGRKIPPYPETRRYVAKVLRYYREYRRAM